MSRIYNTNGSLNYIKGYLLRNNIQEFQSVRDLQRFQVNYASARQKLIADCQKILTDERNKLNSDVQALEHEIAFDKQSLQQQFTKEVEALRQRYNELAEADKTVLQEFTFSFKALFTLLKINYIESFAHAAIFRASRRKIALLHIKRRQSEYLVRHFEQHVAEKANAELWELDRKKKVIDEINTFIYGAIGEGKVAAQLEHLTDEYAVINDFCYTFDKPLYYKEQKTQIHNVQIDHLVVSRAGVFLIETKNWSKESVQNENFRSPVDQICRANYAVYRLLKEITNHILDAHHWADRKIPLHNIVVLMNHKPQVEFGRAKILTPDNLCGYIQWFPPTLSAKEAQQVAGYLLRLSGSVVA